MIYTTSVVQFAPEKGKNNVNLDRIAEYTLQAAKEGSDLVVFPEAIVSGYFLEGGVVELALTSEDLEEQLSLRLVGKLPKKIEIVLGYYEERLGNIYNSSAFLHGSADSVSHKHSYQKFFLPTYGVFDEERFVSRGRELGCVDIGFGKAALMICEDVWHSVWPTLHAVAGATMMIVPSASPARGFHGDRVDNHDRYQRLVQGISEEHGVFTLLAQLIGFEGGKGFIGGSMIHDPFGKLIIEAPMGTEAMIMAELDSKLVSVARSSTPLISDLQSVWASVQKIVADSNF
jgi:N-carbamoylputrescine amidase